MIRWLTAALAALLLTAAPVTAQTVQQSGTVSPGHTGCWVTSGLLKDGGSPSNFQCNALGLYNGTNSPLGISSQTGAGAPSGTWGTLTLGSTSSAASLTTLNSAGTAQPLNLAIGGDATYSIGGTNWLSTIFGQQFCTTTGAVLYRDSGGTWKCLAPGTSGQVLQTQGPNLNPQWAGSGSIGTVTSITAGTGLSGGTITTSGTIALLNPVAVNLGGTGAATLAAHGVLLGSGTTAVNVATPGVSGTVLQSNGAGADPTWNAVAGTGTVTSITAGSTAITVSPSPLVTSGTVDCTTGTSSQLGCLKPDGTTVTASSGAISAILSPGGRLTLTSGVPVMAADATATSTVYYDCYKGGKFVPYYDGTTDRVDTVASCEVSLTMATSSTGVTNSGGVFDVWWVHGGASRICVATNGSGGGWASDTGGSNTARGTGYSQLDKTTRPYITNANAISNCYNGATNYGSAGVNQATYLGTLYTTGAGQTGMAFKPSAASGGSNNTLGLFNAYNQVIYKATSRDSTASWTYATGTWRAADASNSNRIAYVDGLGQSLCAADYTVATFESAGTPTGFIGVDLDSTSAAPSFSGALASTSLTTLHVRDTFTPAIGAHFFQAVELASGATVQYSGVSGGIQVQALSAEVPM